MNGCRRGVTRVRRGRRAACIAFAGRANGERAARSAGLPAVGDYLTDGSALFSVLKVLGDEQQSTVLLELEDCRTLELVVCASETIRRGRLATVAPRGAR